jgi:cell division protein FtsA
MNIDKIMVAIDIGSQKIKVAIAQEDEDGIIRMPAYGICESHGIANGNVKDMDRLKDSIHAAINEAQQSWGDDIDTSKMPVYYSVSGDKVSGKNTDTEMRHIHNTDYNTKIGSVSEDDIKWLQNALETYVLPNGIRKIAMIPQCFQVDDNEGIENPKGLNGQKIKAAGHLVTDSQSHIADLENAIIKAFAKDNDDVEDVNIKLIPVAASFASSLAVLTAEQKESGVALLDIGEGCCDLSVFYNKFPMLTWCNTKAGAMITKEIKTLLNINYSEAEKIKKEFGYANPAKTGSKETCVVESQTGAGSTLRLETLSQWIYPLVKYIFENVRNVLNSNIEDTTYKRIISQNGIVITGGSANLKEIASVAMEIMEDLPVKIGKPNATRINEFPNINEDPSFSTLIGLCFYGMRNYAFAGERKKSKTKKRSASNGGFIMSLRNLVESIKNINISW